MPNLSFTGENKTPNEHAGFPDLIKPKPSKNNG